MQRNKEHEGCLKFRKFRRQLTHISFKTMMEPLRPGMKEPQVRRCPDRHYRNCIYGLWWLHTGLSGSGRSFLHCAGVVSQVCRISAGFLQDFSNGFCDRCLSKAIDLDNKDTMIPRTQEHTEAAMRAYSPQVLWKKYGMLSDIVVR